MKKIAASRRMRFDWKTRESWPGTCISNKFHDTHTTMNSFTKTQYTEGCKKFSRTVGFWCKFLLFLLMVIRFPLSGASLDNVLNRRTHLTPLGLAPSLMYTYRGLCSQLHSQSDALLSLISEVLHIDLKVLRPLKRKHTIRASRQNDIHISKPERHSVAHCCIHILKNRYNLQTVEIKSLNEQWILTLTGVWNMINCALLQLITSA